VAPRRQQDAADLAARQYPRVDLAAQPFAEALETAARVEGDAAKRADTVGRAYLDFAFGQPHAYKLMFDLSQPDKRYPELDHAAARARRTMTDYMKAPVAGGYLAGDPEMLGQIFWAMAHGPVTLAVFDATGLEKGPVAVAELSHRVPEGFHSNWRPA
jgi:hypothetical protein